MRCFLIVMVGVAITVFAARWIEYRELQEEKAELQRQIVEYEDSIAEMQAELDEGMSRDYIIRIARNKLHLYFPDDVIYYNNLNK